MTAQDTPPGKEASGRPRAWYSHLWVHVLIAMILGIILGRFYPALGVSMQPLGDAFVKAIRMLIAPIIFCTVVQGIARIVDIARVGRVALKAIVYFEVLTTIALIIGLIAVNLWKPGREMNVNLAHLDTNTHLSLWQQLGLLAVLLLSSKGAAGVAGAAFVVLAATIASTGTIPVASVALVLGIHRFMSEGLTPTNVVGNAVATIVVAKCEKALDEDRLASVLEGKVMPAPQG